MSDLIISEHNAGPFPLPAPRVPLSIRAAVVGDVPFMDALQKMHSKQVGWMPTAQLEGHINAGRVMITEMQNDECRMQNEEKTGAGSSSFSIHHSDFCIPAKPVGYCIAADRYFKRDDVGIIYQMNVLPGRQRGFVGASLLKAQFERSAYGCKLYSCWCAQDIAANKFWEAMGFVPLAFRTGSAKSGKSGGRRMHIFWQKRIREGDESTAWWFPSETSGGAIRGSRIVLPIPPGTHWSDAKPLVLPGELAMFSGQLSVAAEQKPKQARVKIVKVEPVKLVGIAMGGLRFADPKPVVIPVEKPKREPKVQTKNDPRLVAAARELRDRWLEQVNARPLIGIGKYEVNRQLRVGDSVREVINVSIVAGTPRPLVAA